MGGSHTYSGGNSGIQNINFCEGPFEFILLMESGSSLILTDFVVKQEVSIKLLSGRLPKLEVIRLKDNKVIGLVPPSLSRLIKCIDSGWEYYGHIFKIEGNEFNPQIHIKIKGEK